MSFLTPWALLLTAVAAVPLLLHLLRRRTGVKFDFPAVRYLLRAEREHAREVRLRNLLLMLVRVAIVLAVAFAVARPIGPLPGFGHPPTAVAIVLDNSASTGAVGTDGPALRGLVDAAREVVRASGSGDALTILTLDGGVLTGDSDALFAQLDSVNAIDGSGALPATLSRASALVSASELPERRVVILSDAQTSQWSSASSDSARVPRVLYAPAVQWPQNRGIASLEVEPPYWSPRGGVRAALRGDSASWRLALEGRTIARGRTEQGAAITARAQPTERGWQAGSLALEADEYRGDDVRHFAVHVGDAPALAADPASPFLREAVASLVQSGRARSGGSILLGSAERARRPGVFFAPSDPLHVADANRALTRAGIAWKFGMRRTGTAPLRGDEMDGATATTWYALEPTSSESADTLARVAAAAWAVAGDGYVLVASPPDAASTDLLIRAAFVPWLDRLIAERLTTAAGIARDVVPMQRVVVPVGVDAIESPDSSTRALAAGSTIDAPSRAGVYFWRRGAVRAGALVVNPEAAESESATLAADSLATLLGASNVAASPNALARATFAAGGRRALDTPLLILALVLLVVESWLARRGRAQRTVD